MMLSGSSLAELLEANLLATVDPQTVWMSDVSISDTETSEAQATALETEAAVAAAEVMDAFTYDTLENGMPILHSRPGAPASLFLDFDGYDPESWLPFTQDGDGSTFNLTEQTTIIESWRQVEAWYSMFDLDVTTIQPNVSTQPTAWHVITPSYKNGGLAWSIFPHTSPGSLSDGDWSPFNVQAAIVHEVGHTFGCGHISEFDAWGNNIEVYAQFDDPLRGTVMGGSSQVVDKWYLWHAEPWHNPGGASYLQDDLKYIADLIKQNAPTGYTGDGFRPDDFGGTAGSIAGATPLEVDGVTQSITGIIERLTDADTFSFSVDAAGRYTIGATREEPTGVDLKLSIYNSSGILMAAEDGDPRNEPYSMVNDQFLTLDFTTPGTYYAIVESHGNYSDLGKYNLRVDPLPDSWTSENVGLNARAGYASYNAGTYTLAGGGYFNYPSTSSSIGGTNDSFQYLYQTLQGDGSITVRVSSLGTTQSPKAGVMIRDSLDSNAKSAAVVLTSTTSASFLTRNSTGGSTTSSSRYANTSYLLRLTRTGNVFRAYVSSNGGSSWTQFGGDQTIAMGDTVYIGLVSTANVSTWGSPSAPTNHALNVATMTSASLSGNLNPSPTLNALAAPSNLTVSGKTATSISLSWSDVSGESGYAIERSTDGVNYVQVGTTTAGATSYTDSALTDPQTGLVMYQPYFYCVRAVDAGGAVSLPSDAVNTTPRAGAVSDLVVNSISPTQVVLDWRDVSGETGYRIDRSVHGADSWTTVGNVGKNVPSFTNTPPSTGAYDYRVVTLDAGGASAVSDVVTRLGGLEFTGKEPYQMSIVWDPVDWATRYKVERSTNGTSYSTLTSTWTGTSYVDKYATPTTEYYYRVTAINGNRVATSMVIFAAAPAACALPTPWLTADIGAVGGTGAARYNNGTFTLVAAGSEILGTSDEFRYVYKSVSGDFSYTARVATVEETNYWSKAGLMIRQSTSAGSKHAMIYISPHLAVFQWRSSTNGYVSDVYGPSVTAPYYIRISRNGSTFTGEISPDGSTWTTVGSRTISMTSTVLVGFALCSRDDTTLNTSTFTITPEANTAPTVATAAAASPNPTTTTTTNLSALGADD
ncbi:MAG: DUF1349 domain-containing protein, partial [Pirellulales bacterium]|nr:DUF1349 domain-containing protein [Pirellulales bacterium]